MIHRRRNANTYINAHDIMNQVDKMSKKSSWKEELVQYGKLMAN